MSQKITLALFSYISKHANWIKNLNKAGYDGTFIWTKIIIVFPRITIDLSNKDDIIEKNID